LQPLGAQERRLVLSCLDTCQTPEAPPPPTPASSFFPLDLPRMDYTYGYGRGGGGRRGGNGGRGGRGGGTGGGGGSSWSSQKRKLEEGAATYGGGKRSMGGIPKSRQPGYDNIGSPLSRAATAVSAALARAPASVGVPPPPPPEDISESSLLYSFDEEEEQDQEQALLTSALLPLDIQYTLSLLAMLGQSGTNRKKGRGIQVELLSKHENDEQAQSSSSFNSSDDKFKWSALSTFVQAVSTIYKYGNLCPPTHPLDLQNAFKHVKPLRPRAALLLYAPSSSPTRLGGGGVGAGGWEGGRQVVGGIIMRLRLEGALVSDESERREAGGGGIPVARKEQRSLVVEMFYVCEGLEEVEQSALCLVARLALGMQVESFALTQRVRHEDEWRQDVWGNKYGAQLVYSKQVKGAERKSKGMQIRFTVREMRALLEREIERERERGREG